jgi:hypothetical protein
MGSKFARVTKVADRFVVIVGDEPSRVDTLKPARLKTEPSDVEAQLPSHVIRGPAAALLFGDRTAPTVTAAGAADAERYTLIVTAR